MARNTKHMQQLRSKLAELDQQLAHIQAQRALLIEMINANDPQPKKARAPRSNVKRQVLDLLAKAGTSGLNASRAVEMAGASGVELSRGSVSSLLSRLKNDGIITYDPDGLYRLKQEQPLTVPSTSASITALRPSGVGQ